MLLNPSVSLGLTGNQSNGFNFMKKICIMGLLAGICGFAQATTITSTLGTLEGDDAYAWGIQIIVPTGDQITSATLTFNNITLTASGNPQGTGVLYANLLNSNSKGLVTYNDGDAAGDYFGLGSLLGSAVKFASVKTTESWYDTFNLQELATLNSYLSDGFFAIGLDPDCHYSVGSICFTYTVGKPNSVTTPDVATTSLLFGTSLLGLEVFRRRFVLAKAK
jgi:hypothetical protein